MGLTEASVMGQLLVDLLHPLYVQPAGLGVVDHGFGVVYAHHAVGGLLDGQGGVPGLVDVAVWVVLQDWDVMPKRALTFEVHGLLNEVFSSTQHC